MMSRPTKHQCFMEIAEAVAKRSTCIRRQVGAVIVSPAGHIVASGYNGAPKRIEHCTSETCLRTKFGIPSGERHELCRGVHAEQNAICQAALRGVSVEGCTLYSTLVPCSICTKILINSGISLIIFASGEYNDPLSMEMLKQTKIDVYQYNREKDSFFQVY